MMHVEGTHPLLQRDAKLNIPVGFQIIPNPVHVPRLNKLLTAFVL